MAILFDSPSFCVIHNCLQLQLIECEFRNVDFFWNAGVLILLCISKEVIWPSRLTDSSSDELRKAKPPGLTQSNLRPDRKLSAR